VVDEPDGYESDAERAVGRRFGFEQHPGRARAERHQRRLGLTRALGEDEHRATGGEVGGHGRERLPVAGGVDIALLTTQNRQRTDHPEERADDRVAEQGRFGDRNHRPRHQAQEQHGVHQGVLMIGRDDQGAAFRKVLDSDDLDAPVEHLQHPPRERSDQAVADRHPVPIFPRAGSGLQAPGMTRLAIDSEGKSVIIL